MAETAAHLLEHVLPEQPIRSGQFNGFHASRGLVAIGNGRVAQREGVPGTDESEQRILGRGELGDQSSPGLGMR